MMVIYKVTNLINGKLYIGQSRDVKERWRGHRKCKKSILGRAIQKYGKESFKFEIIDKAFSFEDLNYKEVFYIKFYKSLAPYGYNLESGGSTQKEFSEVTIEKMSEGQRRRFKTKIHPRLGKNGVLNPKSKPVICITTGEIFESARQAAIKLGVHRSHVNEIARSKPGRKSTKGYRFRYIGLNLEII